MKMENKKGITMKKRLILLVLSLVFVSIIGTTFAIFTDVINIGDQTYKSGTLDLVESTEIQVIAKDEDDNNVALDNIAPGDKISFAGAVENRGSLAAKVRTRLVQLNKLGEDAQEIDTPADGPWQLSSSNTVTTLSKDGGPLTITGDNYSLLFKKSNDNTFQDKTYYFRLVVEAIQDRNTDEGDWDAYTIIEFSTGPQTPEGEGEDEPTP